MNSLDARPGAVGLSAMARSRDYLPLLSKQTQAFMDALLVLDAFLAASLLRTTKTIDRNADLLLIRNGLTSIEAMRPPASASDWTGRPAP